MQSIIALLILAASPDAVQPAIGTEASETKPVKVKKVCRPGSATGTRMSSKICKTQSEWDAQLGADSTKLDSQRGGN